MKKKMIVISIIALLIVILIAACTETSPTADSDIEALIQERCSECHAASRAFGAEKTREEWSVTIDRMIDLGANVSGQEKDQMIDWFVSQN
jgi:flagellar basal body-associated protein FliL